VVAIGHVVGRIGEGHRRLLPTSFDDLKAGDRIALTCQRKSGDYVVCTVAIPLP